MVMQRTRECKRCEDCEIRSTLFNQLGHEDMTIMNQSRFVVKYQPGELLFKQGSSFTHVIMVIKGLVKTYFEGPSKDLIIGISKPVEPLIAAGLFSDDRHHFSSRALVEVEACYIPYDHFREVFLRNGHFAEDVLKETGNRSLFIYQRMTSLTRKQVPGRVAEAILYLSHQVYHRHDFDLNLSRQELADFCGATKESTIRVLRDFKDENLIRVDGNHFEILDVAMLQKISELG